MTLLRCHLSESWEIRSAAAFFPCHNTVLLCAGIRNAAGWDWHPGTGALLWAGMERDEMGNDLPDDILAASYPDQPAVNWAWPYCHWCVDVWRACAATCLLAVRCDQGSCHLSNSS